jgi:N,N'-diacetylchitobiose transport system permease protein
VSSAPQILTGTAATNLRPARTAVGSVAVSRRRKKPRWISTTIAIGFALIWVFPIYWMVNTSLKPIPEVLTPTPIFWPEHPTLSNFVAAVTQSYFLLNLRNSVIVVGAALIISIVIAFFATAALTRFRFRGRRIIMVVILAVQMLPATALIIPIFLVFNDLSLVGTYIGLILAAKMDGASTWRILWNVLLPLVLPGVIATSIFAFISAWNEYIFAYTFMQDQTMYTLPIWLASFSTPHTGTDFGGQMAASVLFSLPVVVFFMIIQRRLVAGIAAGAVKG